MFRLQMQRKGGAFAVFGIGSQPMTESGCGFFAEIEPESGRLLVGASEPAGIALFKDARQVLRRDAFSVSAIQTV